MTSIVRNIEKFRSLYPVRHETGFLFGDCRIGVAADRQEIIRELEAYNRPFSAGFSKPDIYISLHEAPTPDFDIPFTHKQPDPGKTKIKEAFAETPDGRIVLKVLTGMVFLFGSGEHLAVGPCLDNMNQIVNFINNRYIEWRLCRGGLLGHAAGVAKNGKGLALAGFSGAGKSTLSLHIMACGADFISNDRLIIEKQTNGIRMYGVAKLPRVNPGTILNNPSLTGILDPEEKAKFSALSPEDLWETEYKFDVPVDTCFGPDRFRLHARMDGLVILNWRHDDSDPFRMEKTDLQNRKDLLPAFMKSTGLFFRPGPDCRPEKTDLQTYTDYLSRTEVWEISGRIDFGKATKACLELLKS